MESSQPKPPIQRLPDFLGERGLESLYLMLNALNDPVLCIDRELLVRYANPAAGALLGRPHGELLGGGAEQWIGPRVRELCEAVLQGEIASAHDLEFKRSEGESVQALATATPLKTGPDLWGVVITLRDITPQALLGAELPRQDPLLQRLLDILPAGVLLLDASGRILRINEAARELLLLDRSDLRGAMMPPEAWRARTLSGEPESFREAPYYRVARGAAPIEDHLVLLEGSNRYVTASAVLTPLAPGVERGVVICTLLDVDRQQRTQQRLRSAVRLNNEINRLLTGLLTERGAEQTIDRALKGAADLLQADFAAIGELIENGETFRFARFYGAQLKSQAEFHTAAANTPYAYIFQNRSITLLNDYATHPLAQPEFLKAGAQSFLATPVYSENRLLSVIYLFRTEPEAFSAEDRAMLEQLTPILSAAVYKAVYEERLSELASTDALTGLLNRREFFRFLDQEIERMRRYQTPFSCLMLDLDLFKAINDRYGHQAGDEALVRATAAMRAALRRADLLARTGGEEFMALLSETDIEGAREAAEKVRSGIEAIQFQWAGQPIRITASLGCAEFRPHESLNEFYARLDRLLYAAKDGGRNRVLSETDVAT
ncbi:MAG: diguanylate cyclase [Leptospirales bacterium]|nr:diguanylate cyclase [Leptospirales bacterium]